MKNPLARDLDHVLEHTRDLWEEVRGGRIFITGGTGFFGCWLLESFAWANDKLRLGASTIVLTRNPESFRKKAPHLASHQSIRLLQGDVTSCEFPSGGSHFIVHAATECMSASLDAVPLSAFDSNVLGTRRVLEFARVSGAVRLLFTSSGAVYGRQPAELPSIPEEYFGAPDTIDPLSTYGHSKRVSEFLCTAYWRNFGVKAMIARCFAFVGPHLPLNSNYAAGNFIGDALHGGPVSVSGDGTPYRSYLYAADLAIWLWTILFRGQPAHPYNVGSERAVAIGELARMVSGVGGGGADVIFGHDPSPGMPAERYVPSTKRAACELGLRELIGLEEALSRTLSWYRAAQDSRASATVV